MRILYTTILMLILLYTNAMAQIIVQNDGTIIEEIKESSLLQTQNDLNKNIEECELRCADLYNYYDDNQKILDDVNTKKQIMANANNVNSI